MINLCLLHKMKKLNYLISVIGKFHWLDNFIKKIKEEYYKIN